MLETQRTGASINPMRTTEPLKTPEPRNIALNRYKPYGIAHTPSLMSSQKQTPSPLLPQAPPITSRYQEVRGKLKVVLSSSLAPSTQRNYNSAIKSYLKFAVGLGISEAEALPTSDELLCMFMADVYGKTGRSYAKSLVSGIHSWHVTNGMVWNPLERNQSFLLPLQQGWTR
jgi:hypothetical protein